MDADTDYGRPAGYLDTASSGLLSRRVRDQLVAAVMARFEQRPPAASPLDSARAKYADLVGVPVQQVAIGSQTSVTASQVAANVTRLGAGDEVLCVEQDFGSVVFPFTASAHTDRFTVRSVPLAELAEHVSSRTAVVALSLVQSRNGALPDLPALRRAVAAHNAWTMVDLTQATGWLPMGPGEQFDPNQFDVTVTAAYKWLCTPRGVTLTTYSQRAIETMLPAHTSWFGGEDLDSSGYGPDIRFAADARRFDVSPVWPQYAGLDASLEVFTAPRIPAIHAHNLRLAAQFSEAVGMPPPVSPIVAVPDPQRRITEAAADAGLTMSLRLGKARFAFHLYNNDDDVGRAVAVVRRARRLIAR